MSDGSAPAGSERGFQRASLRATLIGYAGVVLVVLAVSAGVRWTSPAAGDPTLPKPLSAEMVGFLGPIAPGFEVAGWMVTSVGPLADGALRVVVQDAARARVTLFVRLRDPGDRSPLARTRGLAIRGDEAEGEAARAAAQALASALAEREKAVVVPEDLTMRRHAAALDR